MTMLDRESAAKYINEMLGLMVKNRGSDLFITAEFPPAVKVDRALNEGDEVAGFEVLDVPGHSPGHIAYWRESDRTLIAGDVCFNLHPLTGIPGLREPPDVLTYDPALNREAIRRLAELEPSLTLFGHGPPLRDTRKLVDLAAALPR